MNNTGAKISAVILAAGLSRRMGVENKLLKTWQGKPLLLHVCDAALASNCSSVIVVTGHQHEAVKTILGERNILIVHNADYQQGMASSVKTGIKSITSKNNSNALIMLADMPRITTAMINQLVEASILKSDRIIVATSMGKRRNPVLWPQSYFDKIMLLQGDKGARELLENEGDNVVSVELGKVAEFDLDTQDAFNA